MTCTHCRAPIPAGQTYVAIARTVEHVIDGPEGPTIHVDHGHLLAAYHPTCADTAGYPEPPQ